MLGLGKNPNEVWGRVVITLNDFGGIVHVDFGLSSSFEAGFARGVIRKVTAVKMENFRFTPQYKRSRGKWDGCINLFKHDSFPAGMKGRVTYALKSNDIPYKVIRRWKSPFQEHFDLSLAGIELREYQRQDIITAIRERRMTIKIATGGGKTEIACGIIKNVLPDVKVLIVVGKLSLLTQMYDRIKERIPNVSIGKYYQDEKDIDSNVVVSTIQSLYPKLNDDEVKKWLASVRVFIGDEIHSLPSKTWTAVAAAVHAPCRYGFSATPNQDGFGGTMLKAYIGPIKILRSIAELSDAGYLYTPRVVFLPFVHGNGHCVIDYKKSYKMAIADNDERNILIVNSIKKLCGKGMKILVFAWYNRSHCRSLENLLLDAGLRVKRVHGKSSIYERQKIISDLELGILEVVVADSVWSEGVDLPFLDVVFNAGALKSARRIIQIAGRVTRISEGKKLAVYVDIFDECNHSLFGITKFGGHLLPYKKKGHYLTWHSWERLSHCVEEGFKLSKRTEKLLRLERRRFIPSKTL